MANDVLIPGFAFTGFRSFGTTDLQHVGPMSKVHLLAGPNNSGKSNVLKVAQRIFPALRGEVQPMLDAVDIPLAPEGDGHTDFRIAIPRRVTENDYAFAGGMADMLRRFLQGPTFGSDDGVLWFQLVYSGPAWQPSREQLADLTESGRQPSGTGVSLAEVLGRTIAGISGGEVGADAGRLLNRVLQEWNVQAGVPPVATIGAVRQIREYRSGETMRDADYDGPGLIDRLQKLQNPTFERRGDVERFAQINRFVKTVFEEDAAIEIPYDRQTILVHYRGERLPLENLGTGFQEVVILAAAATVLSDHLVCIEEPEIHLHPTLQRKLLRYLVEETDNQYLIATHSAALLDAERASISAVRLDGAQTRLSAAITPSDVARVSADLGFRASDLVQANAVVWVEGPSDRIYIRHWMWLIDADVLEGVHFSILFYGGALLRYLAANDTLVDEFIALPRINRNFSVVIDSDRTSARARLNETKRRVRREIREAGAIGPSWVTKGYTIENYVPAELLVAAVTEAHPGAVCTWSGDPYENPLGPENIKHRASRVDKSAIADVVVSKWDEKSWPLDLLQHIRELVAMVKRANDLP